MICSLLLRDFIEVEVDTKRMIFLTIIGDCILKVIDEKAIRALTAA